MDRYNLDKLIRVVVNDFYASKWYEFKKEKKFFGIVIIQKGFYTCIYDRYIGMQAPENHVIINDVMFEKPEVVLYFQDGHKKTFYFNSLEDAKRFASNLTNDRKWIY